MTIGPPNFVGVGAQKSGTSWWYSLIRKHPEVYHHPGSHKELHYFNEYWGRVFTDAEAKRYQDWFPRPPGKITGEWTPDYMARFWIPSLLWASAPHAKLLVMLRDPVDRFASGLGHYRAGSGVLSSALVSDAQMRGFYHAQIARLRQFYGREQILLLQYERCVENPQAELRRTYAFLGVDESFVPEGLTDFVHKAPGPKPSLDRTIREALIRLYEPDVGLLGREEPGISLDLWPNFRQLN